MISYKDRTYCSISHRCGNQTCPKILPYTERKHVEKTGLALSTHDFKTEFCGYQAVNFEKLEKRHTAIVYCLFMRSLIENSQSLHPQVMGLNRQLKKIETTFFHKHPIIYRLLTEISKKAYKTTLIVHDNTEIDSFLVLLMLFEDQRGVFIGNLGLKEAIFIRIFNHFGAKTTFELEQKALKVCDTLIKEGKEELINANYGIHFG